MLCSDPLADTARRVPTKDSRCIAYFYEIAVICIYVKKTCRSTSFLMVFRYFALITQPAAENRTITAMITPKSNVCGASVENMERNTSMMSCP